MRERAKFAYLDDLARRIDLERRRIEDARVSIEIGRLEQASLAQLPALDYGVLAINDCLYGVDEQAERRSLERAIACVAALERLKAIVEDDLGEIDLGGMQPPDEESREWMDAPMGSAPRDEAS